MTQIENENNINKSQSYWEQSQESIDSAKFNETRFPKTAIEKAYYSAFYAAHSLLALRGEFPDTHKDTNHKLRNVFCKPGMLDVDDYNILDQLETSRKKATYDTDIVYSPEDAKLCTQASEKLVTSILILREKELLQKFSEKEIPETKIDTTTLGQSIDQENESSELPFEQKFAEFPEQEISLPSEQRNMDPVRQAAQKISAVDGLDKSADGFSVIEGADVTEQHEKYLRDAVKGKQEIQETETANNTQESKTKTIRVGEYVNIETPNGNKMRGKVSKISENSVTIRNGRADLEIDTKVVKDKSWKVTPTAPISKTQTLEFAQQKAKEIMGPAAVAAGAENGRTYSGKIIGKTETYAIQSLNSNSAILHRLEDLSKAEKDGKGQIKVTEGQDFTIARDSLGVVSITPYNREREEKEKERTKKLQRGSQQVGTHVR
jgi:uncharacterized protein (UPF0332 family)/uncharacterized protein YkvS